MSPSVRSVLHLDADASSSDTPTLSVLLLGGVSPTGELHDAKPHECRGSHCCAIANAQGTEPLDPGILRRPRQKRRCGPRAAQATTRWALGSDPGGVERQRAWHVCLLDL